MNIPSAVNSFPEPKVVLQTSVGILVTDIQHPFILKTFFGETLSSTQIWLFLTSRYLTGKYRQVMSAEVVLGFIFAVWSEVKGKLQNSMTGA